MSNDLDRLRIGIACYPTVGGSGILATELGLGLADRGHEVHFMAYADPPRLPPGRNIRVHRVSVSAYPLFKYPPYDLALASKMRDAIECHGIQVLHVHYAIPHALCAYLATQMIESQRPRTVLTLHGTDITVVGSDPAYRAVTRFGIERSDRVLAVSRFLAAETVRLFNPRKEIDVVPNFVDQVRFAPNPDIVPSDEPRIAHLSTFRAVKRPQDVIHAFATIRRRVAAKLLLIGDGPELPACLHLARELGVGEHVEPLGIVLDVERVLAGIHLLLQPSGSEAFGLAALEAMSCGVPVVGYRIGGLPEVVADGKTGFLVPFQDAKALAERALEILESPALWRTMREQARDRAAGEFNIDKAIDTHERIYRAALQDA